MFAIITYDGLDGPGFSPGGIKMVSLADPAGPTEDYDGYLSGNAQAIDAGGGHVVVCVDGAVLVIGVGLFRAGFVQDFRGYAYDVQVVNDLAYISDWERAVVVVDISANPPSVIGRFPTQGRVHTLQVVGDHAFVAAGEQGLLILKITELPAIIRTERTAEDLRLQWNDAAKGMTLQRAANLTNPEWQDLPGSQSTNTVTWPFCDGSEFFRLMMR